VDKRRQQQRQQQQQQQQRQKENQRESSKAAQLETQFKNTLTGKVATRNFFLCIGKRQKVSKSFALLFWPTLQPARDVLINSPSSSLNLIQVNVFVPQLTPSISECFPPDFRRFAKWRQLRLIDRQLVEVDAADVTDVASGEQQLFVHK